MCFTCADVPWKRLLSLLCQRHLGTEYKATLLTVRITIITSIVITGIGTIGGKRRILDLVCDVAFSV